MGTAIPQFGASAGPAFSSTDREKLDSIQVGARSRPPDFVRIAGAVEKSSGGGSGDSVIWTGTNSFQELIAVYIPQPSWRANGYIEWEFFARFKNAGIGTETVTFKLQRAYVPPTEPGTSSATFGLPQTFADVAGASFTSPAIPDGSGFGDFSFRLRTSSLGHVGAVQQHGYRGDMIITDLTPGATLQKPFVGYLATSGASAPYDGLDTTEDLELRWMFQMDSGWTPNGTTNLFDVYLAGADFIPRSGHPF